MDSSSIFLRARYANGHSELLWLRNRAKLRRCPHCGELGAMNAHGFLRGYSLCGQPDVIRGRRFYCSNRGNRPGCGRTVSVLLHVLLARFLVTTTLLAKLVHGVLAGDSVRSTWLAVCDGKFSERNGYRMWHRIVQAQPRLRSLLFGRGPPKESTEKHPLAQMVSHMQDVLSTQTESNLFARFQSVFQQGVLP